MGDVLNKNVFLVKEHVGAFKAANNFDVYDPETKQVVVECREERLGLFTKLLRFTEYKKYTPFEIDLKTPDGRRLFTVKRGIALIQSKVQVLDDGNRPLGSFQQKLFSIGGSFEVLDANGRLACTLKGKWTGWDFYFREGERELAHVTKKWAGIGKELFTSADNYILQIADSVPADAPVRKLILAAVMCIDMVYKE